MKSGKKDFVPQALTGANLINLISLLLAHRIKMPAWSKTLPLILWSTVLTPLYWMESILLLTKPEHPVHPEPVFIIGHWRSGTTYLHYLLAKDKQFGYCSNADAFIPGALFVGRWLTRKILSLRLPTTRPMDDVMLHVDAPQEEEFALMLLTPYSAYHSFVFPQNSKDLLLKSLMLSSDDTVSNRWSHHYYEFLRKLSRRRQGKRLLLKNPANTGRIRHLTRLFPQAKFIYLHRDPQEVVSSTLRMFKAMTRINTLQSFQEANLDEQVEIIHDVLLNAYEKQRPYIKPGNLVEIEYQDFVRDPLTTVKRIYGSLKLDGFEKSLPDFEHFIGEQESYKPHHYATVALSTN